MAVLAATMGVASAAFWLLVHLERPGWVSHEHTAIALWSVRLGFLVLLVARPLRTRLLSQPAMRAAVGVLAALVSATAWTFLAIFLTGGYALAFDANPLHCWLTGSLAGVAVDLSWPRHHVVHESAVEAEQPG